MMRWECGGLLRSALACFEGWTGRWAHLYVRAGLVRLSSTVAKATWYQSVGYSIKITLKLT
jgi:hypothetical protein